MKLKSCQVLILLTICLVLQTSAQHTRVLRDVDLSSLGDLNTLMGSVVRMMMPEEIVSTFINSFQRLFTLSPTNFLSDLGSLGSLGRKRRAAFPWAELVLNNKQIISNSKSNPTTNLREDSSEILLNQNLENGINYRGLTNPLLPVFLESRRLARSSGNDDQISNSAAGEEEQADMGTKSMEAVSAGISAMGQVVKSGAMLGKAASDVAKSGQEMAIGAGKGMEMISAGAETFAAGASQIGELGSGFGKK